MNADTQDRHSNNFLVGVLAGVVVGAGLALYLAPRAAEEIRQRVNDSTRDIRNRASDKYREVSTRVDETVQAVTRKGQGLRDDVADVVVNSANEVSRRATAAKTGPTAQL